MNIRQFLDSRPTVGDVNEKIRLLQEDIRTLQEYKNTHFLPVSRLPSEIFSSIFEDLAVETPKTSEFSKTPYCDWFPVTQVCRQWRGVALGTPRIWSRISSGSTSIQLVELFLKRARSAPLSLLRCYHHTNEETAKLLLRRPHQLREIIIRDCQPEWLSFIHDTPMPLIETMEIDHTFCNASTLPISPLMPPGMEPTLRHLSFAHCTMDLQAPFFSRIHTLKIADNQAKGLIDLLLALRSLVHLESLELAMPEGSDEAPADLFAVLPHLTFLRLTAASIRGMTIITRLSVPSIQSAQVEFHMAGAVLGALEAVASAFYAMIPPPSTTSWKTAVNLLSASRYNKTVVEIWPDGMEISPRPTRRDESEAPFWISTSRIGDFGPAIPLCSLLPTTDPFKLRICETDHIPFKEWRQDLQRSLRRFLRTVEDVQELRIHDTSLMLAILSDAPKLALDKGLRPDLLPSLRSLSLDLTDATYHMELEPKMMRRLRRYLKARKAVGCGIEVLKMIAHERMVSVNQEDLNRMEECVETFDFVELWDPQ